MIDSDKWVLDAFVAECDHVDSAASPLAQQVAEILWRLLTCEVRFLDADDVAPWDIDDADNDPIFGPSHAA